MHYFDFVHGIQAAHSLNKDLPNLPLFDVRFVLLMLTYFLEHVAVVC